MSIRVDAGNGGKIVTKKPKKKKPRPVTSADQNAQGRGGVAPANYKPAISKPQAPKVLPKSVLEKPQVLQKDDPLPLNISNLSVAARNKGVTLTARQAMELLTQAKSGFSTNEWGQFLAPGLAPDPFTANLKSVLRDYYEWTGNLPDVNTATQMVQDTKPGEATAAPKFPKTAAGFTPLTIYDLVSDHANDKNDARRAKHGGIWSVKDIEKWGSVKKADYMRQLANRPMFTMGKEWDVDKDEEQRFTDADELKIAEARDWYMGTNLKAKILKRQANEAAQAAQSAVMNGDGTENMNAINLLAQLSGQDRQDIKNPHTFAGLRQKAFNNAKMSKALQKDMDRFGGYLSTIYPDLKPDKDGHYSWDKQFDAKASLFMFQSNIGDAVAENPYNKESQPDLWKKQENKRLVAMANISIATYGNVKTTDNLRKWMQDAGFLAPAGETAMFSERFTNWLFEDCYMKTRAVPGESQELTMFKFVRDWGGGDPKSLPTRYRKYYDDVVNNFAFTVANGVAAQEQNINPLSAIFDAEIEQLNAWRNGLIPDHGIDLAENGENVGPLKESDPKLIKRDKHGAPLPDEQQGPVEYEKNGITYTIGEDGHFNVVRHTANKHGGKGFNPQGADINIDIEPGSFSEKFYFEIMPKVALVYKIPMEWPAKAYNRVYMTLALMGESEGGSFTTAGSVGTFGLKGWLDKKAREEMDKKNAADPYAPGQGNQLGVGETAVASIAGANPANITIPREAEQYSWHNITASFNAAGEMAKDVNNMSWAKEQLTRMGIDPTVNPAAVFWTDFAWSFALDAMLDAGVGAVAKAGATTTAQVMRKLSSDKLLAHVAAAEAAPEVQGVARLMKQAQDADRAGENILAAELRRQAMEAYEADTGTKVQDALTKLEGMTGDERAKVQAKADLLLKKKGYQRTLADLKLMDRPAWYDPIAGALAGGSQHPIAVAELLGVSAGDVDKEFRPEYIDLIRRIGMSRNQDDIIIYMNRIAEIGKVTLDPGRLMMGKMFHFNSLTYGNNAYDEWFTVLPRDNRISGGLEDAEHHVLTIANATRMGLPPEQAKEAAARAWKVIDDLHNVELMTNLSREEKDLARRQIWDDMVTGIKNEMKGQEGLQSLYDDIIKYAKRNGMKTADFEADFKAGKLTMWDMFDAMRKVKNHKSLGKSLTRGGNNKQYFDEVQSSKPWLIAGRRTKGQQAADLTIPFNLQDLASFMHGKAAHQMAIYSKAGVGPAGFLPSMQAVANVGRTFAVASLSFPISALFIDEFWRLPLEYAKRKTSLGLKLSKEARAAGKEANKEFMRHVKPDAFESLIHEAHEFVPISAVDTPKEYAGFINRWIAAFGKQDFADEFLVWLKGMEDDMVSNGMKASDIDLIPTDVKKEMFKQHLMNFIEDEANADVRAALNDTKRGIRNYDVPEVIQAQIDGYNEQIASLDEMMADHIDDLKATKHELHELRVNAEIEVNKTKPKEVMVPLTPRQQRTVQGNLSEFRDEPDLQGFWNRFNQTPNEQTYNKLVDAIKLRLTRQKEDAERELEAIKAARIEAGKPYVSKTYKRKGNMASGAQKYATDNNVDVYSIKDADGNWQFTEQYDGNMTYDKYSPVSKPKPKAEKPKPAGKYKMKRNDDYDYTGDYNITTSDGRTYKAHYDDGSGVLLAGWYMSDEVTGVGKEVGHHDAWLLGYNKAEMQETLENAANGAEAKLEPVQPTKKTDWVMREGDDTERRLEVDGMEFRLTEYADDSGDYSNWGLMIWKDGNFIDSIDISGTTGLNFEEDVLNWTNRKVDDARALLRKNAPENLNDDVMQAGEDTVFFAATGAKGGNEFEIRWGTPEKPGTPVRGTGLYKSKEEAKQAWLDSLDRDVEAAVDNAPIKPPKEGEDFDLKESWFQEDLDKVNQQLADLERKKGPTFRKETVHEKTHERKTNLQKLLSQVHRPVKRSWIFDWLDKNGYRYSYPEIYTDYKHMGGPTEIKGSFNNPDEVKAWFDSVAIPESEYNRMFYDYKAERLAEYGIDMDSDILQRETELSARVEALRAAKKELKQTRKEFKKIGPPKPNRLTKKGNEYLNSVVDRLFLYHDTPELWDAMQNGTKLKADDIVAMTGRGVKLPDVAGARGRKAGWLTSNGEVGWVPVLSAYAEALPYRMMNYLGNVTREVSFKGNFNVEFKRLLDAGVEEGEAIRMAQRRARKYTDKVMYAPGQTLKESQLGAYFYFLPAYRQALMYWGKEFAKHPFVFNELRQRFGSEMPNYYWASEYGTYIPLPMFLTNNAAEMSVPGLTLPLLLPLRMANSLSGWSSERGDDGKVKYQYTGETKMDWLAENPILSPLTGFASKNVAPISVLDDILYGTFGEDSYQWMETDHFGLKAAASLGFALRKDPMTRRETANKILMAQIARGMRPDLDAYQANLEGSPWWYEMLAGMGFDQPEAILGAISRQFFFRKVNYSPSDIGQVNAVPSLAGKANDRNFWKNHNIFEDSEARSMADAEWQFFDADGDKAKQAAILQKYPKLKAKYDFFSMDAFDREQYLLKPENRWLVPYVTGKTFYNSETGAPLTQQEYYAQMTRGAMIHKANKDFLAAIDKNMVNATWSEKLTVLEKKRDERLKAAHKTMVELINEYSVTDEQKQRRLKSLEGYEKGWWGDLPPEKYANGQPSPLSFMNELARRKWGKNFKKHMFLYDAQAIATAHYWATQDVGAIDPNRPAWAPEGQKPAEAYSGGIEQFYTNDTMNRYQFEEGAGKTLRINDAISRFLEPDDRLIFNINRSMSAKAIKESSKKHDQYRTAAINKILKKQYYELNSAAELEAAIPGIFDPVTGIGTAEEMDAWLVKADDAYQLKKAAAYASGPKADYYSDAYEAAKKKYDATMKSLLKQPIASLFRAGSATALLLSPLVDPGNGKKYNQHYAKMVAKALLEKDVDYEDLVDGFKMGTDPRTDKVESANAWASLLTAALEGRVRIEHERTAHPDDGHIGDVESMVALRLSKYADAWTKRSGKFRRSWGEQGGNEMVKSLLGIY